MQYMNVYYRGKDGMLLLSCCCFCFFIKHANYLLKMSLHINKEFGEN